MNEKQFKALLLLGHYLKDLSRREPDYCYSKEFDEWSSLKSAATIIFERIDHGHDPIMVAQDMAIQCDYLATIAHDGGHLDAYEMFSIQSDAAIDILDMFTANGIKEEIW